MLTILLLLSTIAFVSAKYKYRGSTEQWRTPIENRGALLMILSLIALVTLAVTSLAITLDKADIKANIATIQYLDEFKPDGLIESMTIKLKTFDELKSLNEHKSSLRGWKTARLWTVLWP